MADLDAAIGYVIAHGDSVDRARLAYLRSGARPSPELLDKAEVGQTRDGGWPAMWAEQVPSVDATCFRLGELDDLGALARPAAQEALTWLAGRQHPEGTWEEHEALAGMAPQWAKPGDEEARLYLTCQAAFWLAIGGTPAGGGHYRPRPEDNDYAAPVARAAEAFRAALRPDGTWPSFLATGWLGGSLLYYLGWFYESAQVQVALSERVRDLSPADCAQLAASMRRVGMATNDFLIEAAVRRLTETQRTDGGWESDDGYAFDVHTTLTAIRAIR
ncbi:MAG TPA: squalene--hopene cyclase [Micromonosporaceae bacterium]|nr:squalene--hopene cyclase [Micromonosporaceae bacterium]